ncbi:MAG: DUF4160 domain-containing protein [Oligoflexia bacterium]|nr:DUF4160 domain-containing protein [Oligoflexia bacterium]
MAPTLLRTKNLRIVIYPKDHNPPHVHILGPNAEAKFLIDSLECIYSRGFSEKALKQIRDYLIEKKTFLMEAWHEYQE